MSDKLQTQQEKSISVCNADNNQHDSTMIRLAPTDIEINLSRATKIPFNQIASFGVAFASLPDVFRTSPKQRLCRERLDCFRRSRKTAKSWILPN